MLDTCYMLDIPTTPQTFDIAVNRILEWCYRDDPVAKIVVTCTAYTLMKAYEDPCIQDALHAADMVTADGMPIVWLQKRLGYTHAERIYGPDLLLALCDTNLRHYFWGGNDGIAPQLVSHLRERYPQLDVAGHYSPPFEPVGKVPQQSVIDRINAAQPDIVWVGLGSPKQDLWAQLYAPHLNAKVIIGVGAAFDFLSLNKPQAPRWMQRNGLEWLFRLINEPRRLGKRYIVYNSKFIGRTLRCYWKDLC